MEKRESFIFYRSFFEALQGCPDDLRLQVYEEIMRYGLYSDHVSKLEGVGKSLFELVRPQLDANIRRRENGKAGAKYGQHRSKTTPRRPLTDPKATPNQPQDDPKATPNVNVNVNDNVNVNANVNDNIIVGKPTTRTTFTKPTIELVERYVLDHGYNMDAREFYDYYEANGWMVGKNKMKSWTAAVANWNRREKEIRPHRTSTVTMPNALVTQPVFYDD